MTVRNGDRRGGMKRLLFIGLTAIAFAILLSLGTWQVQRLQWKSALLQSIDARVAMPPAPLADIERRWTETKDVDYWPAEALGRFEHAGEQHFFATHKGHAGYYVYTPLRLADQRIIFVNRGFVPFDRKDASTRQSGQVADTVMVVGLARNRLNEKPSWVVPDNDLAGNIYYWKDLDAMAQQLGFDPVDEVLPFFIDAGGAPNPGGLPVGAVTIIDLPNNHLQYAITWFGLAAALAGVFGFWLLRTSRTTRDEDGA